MPHLKLERQVLETGELGNTPALLENQSPIPNHLTYLVDKVRRFSVI